MTAPATKRAARPIPEARFTGYKIFSRHQVMWRNMQTAPSDCNAGAVLFTGADIRGSSNDA